MSEENKKAKESETAEVQAQDASATDDLGNLEDLDLTVETVEERISPSETNVFDK